MSTYFHLRVRNSKPERRGLLYPRFAQWNIGCLVDNCEMFPDIIPAKRNKRITRIHLRTCAVLTAVIHN